MESLDVKDAKELKEVFYISHAPQKIDEAILASLAHHHGCFSYKIRMTTRFL
jgi:hypothetical protein